MEDIMDETNETLDDYLARLNIEGGRKVWLGNQPKIKYVFNKSKKYLKQEMSACEIGIGDGYLLRIFDSFGFKSTGIDISSYSVETLKMIFESEGLEINLLQRDISEPIDYENAFDVVFCLDVLEHIENLETTFENIKKILNGGGLLIATLPWKENLDDNMVMCPKCHHEFHRVGHFHSFNSYDDIVNMLGENFQILTFGFIPHTGLPNRSIDLLKKTILRKRYYKEGLPNFKSTCFFIARLEK